MSKIINIFSHRTEFRMPANWKIQIDRFSFILCVCVYGWFMTISNATGLASHCKCYITRMHMDDFRRNNEQSMKSSLVSFFRLEFTKRPTYFAFRERKRLFSLIILMGIDIGFLWWYRITSDALFLRLKWTQQFRLVSVR